MQTSLYICYFNTEEPLVHTQVLPYLRAVARAGFRMHLLTYEKRSALRKGERERRREIRRTLAADGIKWHTLKYHKRPSLLATAYDVLLGLLYSTLLLARHRVNIIHARAHVPGAIGLALKRVFRRKLIFDLRGLMAEEYVDNGVWAENSLAFRLVKSVERALLGDADRVVVLTEKLKATLTRDHNPQVEAEKVFVIPCCADLMRYKANRVEREDRAVGPITLVYVGSVTGRYMLGEMIDFFRVIQSKRSRSRFLVLTRANKSKVEHAFDSRGIEKSCYSIVSVEPEQVPALISTADIALSFVKPSIALLGMSPTKVGEYLAAGLPVVSTPGGDHEAILQGENVGVIVNEFDNTAYENAADQILTLIGRDDTTERCREVARRHYSLDEIGGPGYVAVYRSLEAQANENINQIDAVAVDVLNADARCPVCKSTSSEFIGQAREGVTLRKCASCGLAFHNEFSNEAEMLQYYSHYYHEDNLSFSSITQARFHTLLASFETYRESNRILDIGCGAGHFLKVAIESGWGAYGNEIASGAFEQLSRIGVKPFFGELQSANYPDHFFDVVYCSEVLEHLLDPISLLSESVRILRPGGLLYLTTPNYDSLSRRLLGSKWRVFGKEHICYFTPQVLAGVLGMVGFSKVGVATRNIDPHELRKLFQKRSVETDGGFNAQTTEHLREQLEASRSLRLAKNIVNYLLSATSIGDTIYVRAQK